MSVAQAIPTYNTIKDVPATVNDCWVNGVLYHRCGAGRKNNRSSAVPACAQLKPHIAPHYHRNKFYPENAMGERYAITCAECTNRDKQAKKAEYRAETPRDRALVVLVKSEPVTTELGDIVCGWDAEGEGWFPVRPTLSLTRFEGENSLYEAIERDPKLGSVVRCAEQLAADDKRYKMLHLPWRFLPTLFEKFGNERTLPVQHRVQEAIESRFGVTREQVGRNIHAAMGGAAPRAFEAPPSVMFDRNPEQIRALLKAHDDAERAEIERAAAYAEAEQEAIEAERELEEARALEAKANERKRRAAYHKERAGAAYDDALRALNDAKQALDTAWYGEERVAYFYIRVYGVKPEPGMLTIPQVEVGETGSLQKNNGNAPPARWSRIFPCVPAESAYAIQEYVRNRVFGMYKVRQRRDHMFDLDGVLFWKLVRHLEKVSALTLEHVQQFTPLEAA